MTWHYRILCYPNGNLALHEVYCDEAGAPASWTKDPITFGCDGDEGIEGIAGGLEMALADARRRPVLDIPTDDRTPYGQGPIDNAELLHLKLDPDVVTAILAYGPGYEQQVEAVLREALAEGRL